MAGNTWGSGPVVLGCGNFGGIGGAKDLIGRGLDEAAAMATLDEAAALGITMLDTAERYAAGASETMIGRWLSERPSSVTSPIRITTKVAPAVVSGRDDPFDATFIEPIVATSLERLGVEQVEWLLTHAPDDATPIETTLEALEAIRESGRCSHVGGCNLDIAQLRDALNAAERLGLTGYELVQNGYSLLQPDAEGEVRRLCHERELAFVAFSPLAGGVLTGKYRRDEPPAAGTRLDLRPEGFDELMTPPVHDAIDALTAAAADLGVAPGALALAWLIHRADVTALISGPSRAAPHVELAAQAMQLHLTDAAQDELADAFRIATAEA